MIKRQGNKWVVKDAEGNKTLGSHPGEKAALRQLAAIEINKKKRQLA